MGECEDWIESVAVSLQIQGESYHVRNQAFRDVEGRSSATVSNTALRSSAQFIWPDQNDIAGFIAVFRFRVHRNRNTADFTDGTQLTNNERYSSRACDLVRLSCAAAALRRTGAATSATNGRDRQHQAAEKQNEPAGLPFPARAERPEQGRQQHQRRRCSG